MLAKSFAVYLADLYTAIALLASDYWAGTILQSEAAQDSNTVQVPFTIGKWIFTGCIIFSFLLLLWEARKARAIVRSRDISYAFTNVMSQNYYSMKSYDYFCLFRQVRPVYSLWSLSTDNAERRVAPTDQQLQEEEGRHFLLHLLHLQRCVSISLSVLGLFVADGDAL